mmetsp:Transcript_2361/g.8713  ORF Transcript_2361/g.8713 Transcript_2361/m.8713 type:complete len:310 (+) Transcript_2361:183-1112(+)
MLLKFRPSFSRTCLQGQRLLALLLLTLFLKNATRTTVNCPAQEVSSPCEFVTTIPATNPFNICTHDPEKDIYVSGAITTGQNFDEHISSTISRVLTSKQPTVPVYVDIGGNIGLFTLLAASLGARTISFEPLLENYHLLSRSVALNGYSNSKLIFAALADHVGLVDLYKWSGNFGSTFVALKNDTRIHMDGVSYQASALTVQLDSMFDMDVDLVKIDCEGCETRAILGARSLISAKKLKTLVIEVQPHVGSKHLQVEAFRLFELAGYSVFKLEQPVKYSPWTWQELYKVLHSESLVLELVITITPKLFH